ncbi:MAG: LTA synthase family protein [Bacteroidales bacterium]|nr:MAG: LTA synthase family protein [Bacteroidales bacterium]
MDNRYKNFVSSLRYLFWILLIGIVLFFISRLIFLLIYGNLVELSSSWTEVIYAFAVGFKFDVKVLTIALLPLSLLCLLQLLNNSSKVIYGFYYRMSVYYGLFVLFLFTLISVIDFYFYKFFNTHISVLFFGIIEDDTKAVLKSVWTDYPVVLIFLSLLTITILFFILLRWLFRKEVKWVFIQSPWLKAFTVLLFLGVYFLGLRGSTGMKPLGVRHSTISKNTFINTLTLNGAFSLFNAYSDKKETSISTDISKMIESSGFKSPKEAIERYIGRVAFDSIGLANNLLVATPQDSFLASNPPHVVFILMESMNDYYFDLNTPETNVLGKLEGELSDCYVFRNFLSASMGTIFSLEGILVGSPIAPLSQSVYQNRALSSSVAKPFKDKGYSTSFITGGEMGWRSLDKFIYNQYFENIEGGSALKRIYTNATTCEWGVHDEYTFRRIHELLKEAKGKPQFVVGFTISNHTPFETPNDYKQYPLSITEDIKTRLKVSPEIAYKNLLAYQYANSCLGQFINDIRNSPLGENTIIVVTGDHTNNQLFEFADKDLLKRYAVPFILYVPERYKPKRLVNTQRFGSHKDIFPTLFNLALSDVTYLKTGNNLLSVNDADDFGLYCYSVAMNSIGLVDFRGSKMSYKWESDSTKVLLPLGSQSNEALDSLYVSANAYIVSMKYYILNELGSRRIGE